MGSHRLGRSGQQGTGTVTSGIAVKLGLLLAVVGLLASGLTGYYAYDVSRGQLVQSAKNELLTSTSGLARRIALARDEISRNLQVLSSHPSALSVLQKPSPAQEEQLATLFKLMMEANPGYFQVRLISAADNGMERVRVDRDGAQLVRVTGDELQEKGHFPYVSDTLKMASGGIYLSRIDINHERGAHEGQEQPTVRLAAPLTDRKGQVLGAVVINIDLNRTFKQIASNLPKDTQFFLTNRDGDFLIHPDNSQSFGFDKGRRVLVQDEFPATRSLVESKFDQVVFEATQGRYADAPVVAAFVGNKVRATSDETRLLLGLAQPLSAIVAQADQLGLAILQIVGGFCLACILLATFVARAVTRPIDSMSNAAQRFANGYEIDGLPVDRKDEIGVLARSFSQMQAQIKQQLTALQDSQKNLEHLALHDMLTGLPNRRLFHERLEQAVERGRRNGERFALLFIDLDNFKDINDQLGHEAGDAALKEIAQRLASATRKVDTVARLGGDEFVVLLNNPADRKQIASIARQLLDCMRSPIPFGPLSMRVSFSIGIGQYPDDGDTASEIISSADHAMYLAKTDGRNSFRFCSGDTVSEPLFD